MSSFAVRVNNGNLSIADSLEKLNIQNNEFKNQISILKNQLATTN